MASVDPYVIRIPQAFLSDPEVARWFEYDNRWKHDMWISVTGGTGTPTVGSDDTDTSLEIAVNRTSETVASINDALEKLSDSMPEPIYYSEPTTLRAVSATSDHTAVDHEFINATNNARITLPLFPVENSVILIRNGDGTLINISGNGRNINGSQNGTLRKKGTTVDLHYFITENEWFAA
jgi:hypothetical protein